MVAEYEPFRKSTDESYNVYHAIKYCRQNHASGLRFRKGVYHFGAEMAAQTVLCVANHGENGFKRSAFLLEDTEDFFIDGGGSRFVFDSVMNMFTVLGCKRISIRNLSVEMPVYPYPEGTVTATSENWFDVVFSYYREITLDGDALVIRNGDSAEPLSCNIEFNGSTHEIEHGTGDNSLGAHLSRLHKEHIGYNTFRIYNPPRMPAAGNVLAVITGKRYSSGFFFQDCKDITLENVTIHSCVGIGVMAQMSRDITLRDCRVTAAEGKYVSSAADATHFVGCTGKIVIENCLFEHMLDDALNVHGVYVKILRSEEGMAVIQYRNPATSGIGFFRPGDLVCELDPDTLIPEKSFTVTSVNVINNEITELGFEGKVSLTPGNVLENLSVYPELYVKGCTIRNNRARGILIATGKHSIIENCSFHTGGSAILLECDGSFWYESGAVKDLEIRGNRFEGCKHAEWGRGVISVPSRKEIFPGRYYHGRIAIADNEFISCYDDMLFADNVSELIFEGNRSESPMRIHLRHIGKRSIQPGVRQIIHRKRI